ncbi:MAG: carbohydrate kinase family protein [Candidatus Micrarchaeia archaeon]
MLDIITLGHIIYDIRCYVENFPRPDKTSFMQTSIQTGGGGSAANVAADAVLLGHRAGVIGNVGSDREGAFLLQDLLQAGVDISHVRVKRGRSGMSIVIVDKNADVEVVEMLGVSEPVEEVDLDYIAQARFLHMTGCNLDALRTASTVAKRGVAVSFDPGRGKAHLGEKKLSPILKNTDYLFVNRHELGALTGEHNLRKAARALAKKFHLTVFIKCGADPVVVVEPGGTAFESEQWDVRPVDTIGAGDAFAAGVLCALAEGKRLASAVRFGNAVAAAKILHRGARLSTRRKEIEKKFGV